LNTKQKTQNIDGIDFSLGGNGHPPATIYHFSGKPKETVYTKKLHANEKLNALNKKQQTVNSKQKTKCIRDAKGHEV